MLSRASWECWTLHSQHPTSGCPATCRVVYHQLCNQLLALVPAVLRGRADEAPTYLTTSATYISVHSMLCKPAEAANLRVMKYTSLVSLWHDRCPSIKFMKPCEDLWLHCEQLRAECKTAASEEARTQTLSAGTSHTELARVERPVYHFF